MAEWTIIIVLTLILVEREGACKGGQGRPPKVSSLSHLGVQCVICDCRLLKGFDTAFSVRFAYQFQFFRSCVLRIPLQYFRNHQFVPQWWNKSNNDGG